MPIIVDLEIEELIHDSYIYIYSVCAQARNSDHYVRCHYIPTLLSIRMVHPRRMSSSSELGAPYGSRRC